MRKIRDAVTQPDARAKTWLKTYILLILEDFDLGEDDASTEEETGGE